jgi:hypothetical protein
MKNSALTKKRSVSSLGSNPCSKSFPRACRCVSGLIARFSSQLKETAADYVIDALPGEKENE